MKYTLFLGLTAAVAATAAAASSSTTDNDPSTEPRFVPGRYMVEFGDDSNRSPFDSMRQKWVDVVEKTLGEQSMSIVDSFDHALMKGVTMQLNKQGKDIANTPAHHVLAKMAAVDRSFKVYPVRMLSSPKASLLQAGDYGVGSMNATGMSPHAMTQVDRVHRELKKTGKGMVIGVIDNGIDYYHEAFGINGHEGCFGNGCKVVLGYDLVGDDFNPNDPNTKPKPDADPYDSCGQRSTGHGTHVSGIIAGNSSLVRGVAPDATLGMWKVYGCYPATSEDIVVKAMMEAYHAGVDVISVSVGTDNGWAESPMAVAAQRIAEKGVPVVIAAGNRGLNGAYTVEAPAKDATIVASFDNDNFYTSYFVDQRSGQLYPYHPSQLGGMMPNGTLAAGDVHLGSNSDACDCKRINRKVDGHLALVRAGGCSLDTKLANLHKAGATGVIVYTDDDVEISAGARLAGNGPATPLVTTFRSVGDVLAAQLAKGIKVTLLSGRVGIMPYPTGKTVSAFSSIGASNENDLKPDIGSIGGSVFSSLPRVMGNYGVMSGTSMAAPYVSASIALYLEAHGKKAGTPRFINEQLQNYGYKAPHYYTERSLDTPLRQGAGLLQLYDAIQQTVHASPGRISFNDTAHQTKSHTITLTNRHGTSIASYHVLNNVSVAVHPLDGESVASSFAEPTRYSNRSASLRFSKRRIRVAPGKSVSVTVSVIVPSDMPRYTMYSGYVQFKSDHPAQHKDLSVPYMGIVGDLHALSIFGNGTPFLSDANQTRAYRAGDTYECRRSDPRTYPVFYWSLARSSAHIAMELHKGGRLIGHVQPTTNYSMPRNTNDDKFYINAWDLTYTPIATSPHHHRRKQPLVLMPGKYTVVTRADKWLGKGQETHTSATIVVRQ